MKNSTIKVCHIANTDIAVRFLLLNQLNFLKSKGYKVYAVCSQGELIKDIEKQGIQVKIINFNRGINLFIHLISFLKLFFYFRKEKFDIVHAHTPVPGLLGQLAARMTGVPVVINTIHGFYFSESLGFLKRNFYILIEKISARCSDLVFSVSRGIIDTAIEKKICSKDLLCYLGKDIDTNRFNAQRFSPEFINEKKRQLKISPDLKIVGIVGRLVKEKGYLELFEAFKTVIEKFPKTLLLIIGPEEVKKKDKIGPDIVKKFGIEKNVLFLGQRIDVDELYSLMDVFVLPSYREGIGASVLEALAMERPVIASRISGLPESVEDGETGILIPPKNVEKLTEAIIYLFNNPEKARQIGLKGREKILTKFSQILAFNRIAEEYQKLIEKKLKPKKIKVCHIASVELIIRFILLNSLKFLKNQGYEVSVVCSPGKWIQNIRKEGIKEKTIRFKRKFSPFSDLIAFLKLYFYFKKEKFDIVHTHTLKPKILGQLAAKLAKVPIIINTNHGFDFSDDTSFIERKLFIFLEKIVARCSDLIFSVSRLIIETTIKEGISAPDLLSYWGEGVDIARFDPKRFSPEFINEKKRQLGIDLNNRIIGIVARLVEEKGYLELFESFRAVLDKFPGTMLLVVGPREPEKKDAINPDIIKKFGIEKNVLFLGERTDMDELYPLMDIFVLPTHREGVGVVILEASAMEKPVIATTVGGCPEAAENGKTGILIPPKNVEKLTEAIIYLFNNPEKAKQMGLMGRRKIEQEFDEKFLFDRIEKEYQRLINQKLS